MNIDNVELEEHEAFALVVLAKCMIHADGVVSKDEMLDLMSLGEVLGTERLMRSLEASASVYRDMNAVAQIAARVDRYDARVLIFVLLEELAKGDGDEAGVEMRFLKDLQNFWELGYADR
ncbi:MAG: hypothetical protein KC656_10900 [Myxococcales bacterium]|nr:hypothetical protein [Myxococcales bacterium]MCB9672529.1 hypothetical protein [Alphaproteobacteria bacterium]MCB9692470.1 hypothetical protein [Alphaproteobacteria bacterium]